MGSDDNDVGDTADLPNLKQQRKTMKRNMTNIKLKVDKDKDSVDVTILECRLQILESYFKQILFLQRQIEKLNPEDTSRSEIEELYIVIKASILSFMKGRRSSNGFDTTHLNVNTSHQFRLPKIKLPRFGGKYGDYNRFITSFNNMIHNDSSIPIIEKFNYLLNCLEGPALAVVQPFQVIDENYPKAIARLKERYDNKVLIFLDHISELFELPQMQADDAASLRTIVDTTTALRASLLSLGDETNIMDSMLIHLVSSKLDADSKLAYDEKQEFKELPTYARFANSIERRCQFLECRPKKAEPKEKQSRQNDNKAKSKTGAKAFVTTNVSCYFCQSADHFIGTCSSFQGKRVDERFEFVKKNGLCINCLRKGHSVAKCKSQSRCRVCRMPHHTLLHKYQVQVQDSQANFIPNAETPTTSQGVTHALIARSSKMSLIPTAIILMKDSYGNFQPVRALLDSGSEVNFVTEETAKRLELKFNRSTREISCIDNMQTQTRFCTSTTIKSRLNNFECHATFSITKLISSHLPADKIDTACWKIPDSFQLADPQFYKPNRIDVLISTEVFFDLLLADKFSLGDGLPILVNTEFGWIVGGKINNPASLRPLTCNLAIRSKPGLDDLVCNFWKIEEYLKPSSQFTEDERLCEQHFVNNVSVAENGRVQVRLPFKHSPQLLGNSYDIARKRFLSIERRLCQNKGLQQMYGDFMNEYINLGHMTQVEELEDCHYIIPHHCVLRLNSETTKLRVVFDASAKTSSNFSLNDLLFVGPTIQQDLITTLLTFRLHKYAITADISKMYRQFLVHDSDRKYQIILWRSSPDQPLKMFKLNTVTYGTSAAPYLAVRCLFFIADLHETEYPNGAKVLREDLYVDDLLTGANDISEVNRIRSEVTAMLAKAGLTLAKWNSNTSKVFDDSSDEFVIKTSTDYVTKTLGMSWKPANDVFCFNYDLPDAVANTKRSVLSTVAKVFDLLGLLSPVTVRCKIFIQELWKQHLEWDQPLPVDLKSMWSSLRNDLYEFNKISISRYVFTENDNKCEIHGFADASERAYGCCIYVRTKIKSSYKVSLLVAKSKVAPIKAQSVPRLELCAALLLCRTWKKFESKVSPFLQHIYFWTDSKIVLQWLLHHASTLNCFVANRISELQEKSEGIIWRHVPSKENPADIISRGCSAHELPNTMWFTGPTFLTKEVDSWPFVEIEYADVTERRKGLTLHCNNNCSDTFCLDDVIARHSSYLRIVRITAYVLRILTPQRHKPRSKTLTVADTNRAFWVIVAAIQRKHYFKEIADLQANKVLKPSLQKLTPFIHKSKVGESVVSLLRVGGRLAKSPLPFNAKFPALLPKNSRFLQLYIDHLHRFNLHASSKVLLGLLRQRVWVVNGREVTRKAVQNCIHCFHYKPKLAQQLMGDLPRERFHSQTPFFITGVDFCGPFYATYRLRGRPPYKTYAAIFICFATKAIHAELASDLSTNCFLLCLKRFTARRGVPMRIYCDNATNFTGASSKLRELKEAIHSEQAQDMIQNYCTTAGFEFHFIPPRAPHFGGLWEAAVKSMKLLLVKYASQANLTFEELQTVLIDAEAILNSRPLCESEDPNDGEALTPGHLLIGRSIKAIPEPASEVSKFNNLTQYQRITFLKNQFWKMWLRDFVQGLQQRMKWLCPHPNIEIGQVVIVHEDNLPPQQWLLARVMGVTYASDGKVRVVDLKTSKGQFRRPIHKIAPLPTTGI